MPKGNGAGNRNRTYDLRITNAPLYQLSYSGIRTPMEPSGVRILNAPQADEKFNASVFRARGRGRQAIKADFLGH